MSLRKKNKNNSKQANIALSQENDDKNQLDASSSILLSPDVLEKPIHSSTNTTLLYPLENEGKTAPVAPPTAITNVPHSPVSNVHSSPVMSSPEDPTLDLGLSSAVLVDPYIPLKKDSKSSKNHKYFATNTQKESEDNEKSTLVGKESYSINSSHDLNHPSHQTVSYSLQDSIFANIYKLHFGKRFGDKHPAIPIQLISSCLFPKSANNKGQKKQNRKVTSNELLRRRFMICYLGHYPFFFPIHPMSIMASVRYILYHYHHILPSSQLWNYALRDILERLHLSISIPPFLTPPYFLPLLQNEKKMKFNKATMKNLGLPYNYKI